MAIIVIIYVNSRSAHALPARTRRLCHYEANNLSWAMGIHCHTVRVNDNVAGEMHYLATGHLQARGGGEKA